MKSVRIWSFSGPYFPAFRLITNRYLSVFSPNAGKYWPEKLLIQIFFHAVLVQLFFISSTKILGGVKTFNVYYWRLVMSSYWSSYKHHIYSTLKRLFPRRFGAECTWCVCWSDAFLIKVAGLVIHFKANSRNFKTNFKKIIETSQLISIIVRTLVLYKLGIDTRFCF